jgi:HK97 family phage major capsid protein
MDDAYIGGNGVAQPLGVRGHPATINVARTGPGAVVYADFVAMIAASRGTAKRWLISQTVIPQIALATLPGGLTPLWQPSASAWGSVLGYPVDIYEAAPVLGSAGDVLLLDWQSYVIKDGVSLRVDMTNAHSTNFIQNRSVLKCFGATDGQPMLTGPITLADGVTQVSPFVCLV